MMKIDLRGEVLKLYDGILMDKNRKIRIETIDKSSGQYNVLAHLSTYFNDDIIIDIGTGHGAVSARALSYNETNIVYSYDTEFNEKACDYIKPLDNVEYNVTNPLKNRKDRKLMLSASLISLDVDPHDGKQEVEFYNFFVENNWKGIMVCDDINMGRDVASRKHTAMAAFWEYVDKPKYNITNTSYSHFSGTGIICFDDQEVLFNLDETKTTDDPVRWVHSQSDVAIMRFDDGTFETNYGITGNWSVITKNTGEEKIVIETKSGFVEIPNVGPEGSDGKKLSELM